MQTPGYQNLDKPTGTNYQPTGTYTAPPPASQKSFGVLIAVLVVVAIGVVAALLFATDILKSKPSNQPSTTTSECTLECYNGGKCSIEADGQVCNCKTGYTGDFCETKSSTTTANACKTNNGGCDANANCQLVGKVANCVCKDGYIMDDTNTCVEDVPPSPDCSLVCRNGGTCVSLDDGTEKCNCKTGFRGTLCETKIAAASSTGKATTDPCAKIKCLNGGTCQTDGTCKCAGKYTGDLCEVTPAADCTLSCANGGSCVVADGAQTCKCANGYTGPTCAVAPCSLTCQNGGTCVLSGTTSSCKCADGFSGTTCADKKVVGPCDIYEAAGNPCVAAHSTVRALYGSFSGNLYQVRRKSDSKTQDIPVEGPGGFANTTLLESFCGTSSDTACLISILYDQSPKKNHLTRAPGGMQNKSQCDEAYALRGKLSVGGHKVYGLYIEKGMGYRNNKAQGLAKGDEPEGMYWVIDGTRYGTPCCFDYGNGETTSNDDGAGTMEALYFGNNKEWGWGAGNGPWMLGDMENGMYSGTSLGMHAESPTVTYKYVTGWLKGKPHNWCLKIGDANNGTLKTTFNGRRPDNSVRYVDSGVPGGVPYDPMRKQGAVLLGTGGDNSNGSQGTFYEGAVTLEYPTDATEEAIQANVVALGYGK